jgi:beta-glucosidase
MVHAPEKRSLLVPPTLERLLKHRTNDPLKANRPPTSVFPTDFVWGAATAAYQIEGSWQAHGKGPSIWDTFAHQPGKIFGNHTGDVSADHYRLWKKDIALMRELELQAYRFSLSWSRILPGGTGKLSPKGLSFYNRLIDELLTAGITPWVTLYHWDLPEALQRRGGFLNRDMVEWFGDFAALAAKSFGDRVKHWITFNEPQVVVGYGLQDGIHAPGLKLPFSKCLLSAHHLLMAHGRAVQALRAGCRGKVRISLANCGPVSIPQRETKADIAAARRVYFAATERTMWNLSWWADPIVFGRYPSAGVRAFGNDMPCIKDSDMALIAQPIDFLAHNCYNGFPVRAGRKGPERVPGGWGVGNPRGTLPWLEITPDVLYWAARFQTERYKLPLVFTESGFCNVDFVQLDGRVRDPQRIDCLTRLLRGLHRALAEGIRVDGYMLWSLLDNLEWAEGFKDRFGLVHVDFQTQQRTPKDSFYWYREVIRSAGATLF